MIRRTAALAVALAVGLTMVTVTSAGAVEVTYVVTNTNDSGPGSLRQAILDSNAVPSSQFAPKEMHIDVAGTLHVLTPLPAFTDYVRVLVRAPFDLDGTTCACDGAAGITVDSPLGTGIDLWGPTGIGGFETGVLVRSGGLHMINGTIGTNQDASEARPNGEGARVLGPHGRLSLYATVVSGNLGHGVVSDTPLSLSVQYSSIGVSEAEGPDFRNILPNGGDGILARAGTVYAQRNHIEANVGAGIRTTAGVLDVDIGYNVVLQNQGGGIISGDGVNHRFLRSNTWVGPRMPIDIGGDGPDPTAGRPGRVAPPHLLSAHGHFVDGTLKVKPGHQYWIEVFAFGPDPRFPFRPYTWQPCGELSDIVIDNTVYPQIFVPVLGVAVFSAYCPLPETQYRDFRAVALIDPVKTNVFLVDAADTSEMSNIVHRSLPR